MPAIEFVHLHVRSEYSPNESVGRVVELARRAKAIGLRGLALTDRNTLAGLPELADECREADVRPLFGCLLTHGFPQEKAHPVYGPFSLLLYALNEEGHGNLCRLMRHTRLLASGFGCSVPFDLLAGDTTGLAAVVPMVTGYVNKALDQGNLAEADLRWEQIKSLFGAEKTFLEVRQCHFDQEENAARLQAVYAFATRHNARLVATHKVLFAEPEQAGRLALSQCLSKKAKWKDFVLPTHFRGAYLQTPEQMAESFAEHPEALRNTMVLAEMCALKNPMPVGSQASFPDSFSGSSDGDANDRLAAACHAGLINRLGASFAEHSEGGDPFNRRLESELADIRQMGGAAHFLLLAGIFEWARQESVPVLLPTTINGSFIAYLLGLTELNPLAFGLAWERFLPRLEPLMDIQIWAGSLQHKRLHAMLFEKLGTHAASVAHYQAFTFADGIFPILELASLTTEQAQTIKGLIRRNADFSWSYYGWECVGELLNLEKDRFSEGTDLPNLLKLATDLDGVAVAVSEHPDAVLISGRDLSGQIPRVPLSDGRWLVQYPQPQLCGLWPYLDIKAQPILSRLARAEENVRRDFHRPTFSLRELPLDDLGAFEFLQSSDAPRHFSGNEAVFSASELCACFREVKVSRMVDIAATFALCRPGAIEFHAAFLAAKFSSPLPTDPGVSTRLAAYCLDTYGVMIFQEQCLPAIAALRDCSLRDAEQWRRRRGKGTHPSERADFVEHLVSKKEIKAVEAELIFAQLAQACEYSFHKGYALTWALLFYRCAYLLRHYPLQYHYALEFEMARAHDADNGEMALNFLK